MTSFGEHKKLNWYLIMVFKSRMTYKWKSLRKTIRKSDDYRLTFIGPGDTFKLIASLYFDPNFWFVN